MEEKEKKNKTKRIVVLCICAIALVLASTLGTYAYFLTNAGRVEKQELTYTTGTLVLIFEDNSDGINEALTLGESVTKEFKIRNAGTLPVTTNMLFSEMTNTYMEGSLTYKLEYKTSESGDWTDVVSTGTNVPKSSSSDDYLLAKDLTVLAGETYYYKLTITFNDLDKNQNEDINAIFSSKFKLGEEPPSASEKTLAKLKITVNEGSPNFANPATTNEGVFAMADDYGTSYYYRGAVENNYVKFGDFYWRIIRINGDGSLRIIYDGTQGYANGTNSADRFAYTGKVWNTEFDDAKYVGWMYGPVGTTESTSKEQAQTNTTNSELKTLVDEWYKTNIEDKNLSQYVADGIFCNDRSTPGKDATGWSSDTALGFGKNYTAYGASSRLGIFNLAATKTQPIFTCPQKNDAFTVSDKKFENGDLTYPVGLITADEIITAGGKYGTLNTSYYLYNPNAWSWSLSPSYMYTSGYASMFGVDADGYLGSNGVNYSDGGVAPVINLKPKYVKTMIGTGTITDPYKDANATV